MKRIAKLPSYFVLILLSALFLVPFLWTVSTALKANEDAFTFPPQWIPNHAQWDNFPKAWTALPFTQWVLNTLFITVVTTAATVITSSLVAYGFSRFKFRGRNAMFYTMLATMMLPGQVTMIPVFMIWRTLGAIDTFYPLILPAFFGGGAFNIFLMRQFFLTLPREYDEAAMLDGAGFFRIWWKILLPLSGPVIATVAVLSFISHWDEFNGPLIYLNSPEKYTVSIGLRMFQDSYGSETNQLMAASLIHILPTIVLFFFAQRYFMKGINLSGLGGR
ncbi:MAG: carbohydrate ABC transporter permease [Fimbriimonadaceae bacterium]|nr:carbohydrate ABC transporter permease [Fimbriimonadaceae bacterium]